jgi:hypothetical protein
MNQYKNDDILKKMSIIYHSFHISMQTMEITSYVDELAVILNLLNYERYLIPKK